MNNRIAYLLSALLHPLLMPTLLFGIIFFVAPDSIYGISVFDNTASVSVGGWHIGIKLGLLALIFVYTYLLPVLFIYQLYRMGIVKSLEMKNLNDRRFPYLITLLLYTLVTAFCKLRFSTLSEITWLMGGITFSIALVTLVSLYWKISAHATGIMGLFGSLLGLLVQYKSIELLYATGAILILAGAVATARLQTNAHTILQVLAGSVLGFVVGIGFTWFL